MSTTTVPAVVQSDSGGTGSDDDDVLQQCKLCHRRTCVHFADAIVHVDLVAYIHIPIVGADCEAILIDADCAQLLEDMATEPNNTTTLPSFGSYDKSCHAAFNLTSLSFYSDCECEAIPTVTRGNCTLRGYHVGDGGVSTDAGTHRQLFCSKTTGGVANDPPVAQSRVAWNLDNSCGQADLIKPSHTTPETAVDKFTGRFDSGGGFSDVFSTPTYQQAAVADYLNSGNLIRLTAQLALIAADAVVHSRTVYRALLMYNGMHACPGLYCNDIHIQAPPFQLFNASNRAYPDISVVGHNYVIVVNGAVHQVDGTSGSAPVLAGLVSLLNQRLMTAGTPLEDVVGASYTAGSNKCTRFSCCTYGYESSATGFDAVTGLGTLNFQATANYLGVGNTNAHDARTREPWYVAAVIFLTVLLVLCIAYIVYERRPKLLFAQPRRQQRATAVPHRRGLLAELVGDQEQQQYNDDEFQVQQNELNRPFLQPLERD
eukprot:21069-Heterococcus_DN1.PRE.2